MIDFFRCFWRLSYTHFDSFLLWIFTVDNNLFFFLHLLHVRTFKGAFRSIPSELRQSSFISPPVSCTLHPRPIVFGCPSESLLTGSILVVINFKHSSSSSNAKFWVMKEIETPYATKPMAMLRSASTRNFSMKVSIRCLPRLGASRYNLKNRA